MLRVEDAGEHHHRDPQRGDPQHQHAPQPAPGPVEDRQGDPGEGAQQQQDADRVVGEGDRGPSQHRPEGGAFPVGDEAGALSGGAALGEAGEGAEPGERVVEQHHHEDHLDPERHRQHRPEPDPVTPPPAGGPADEQQHRRQEHGVGATQVGHPDRDGSGGEPPGAPGRGTGREEACQRRHEPGGGEGIGHDLTRELQHQGRGRHRHRGDEPDPGSGELGSHHVDGADEQEGHEERHDVVGGLRPTEDLLGEPDGEHHPETGGAVVDLVVAEPFRPLEVRHRIRRVGGTKHGPLDARRHRHHEGHREGLDPARWGQAVLDGAGEASQAVAQGAARPGRRRRQGVGHRKSASCSRETSWRFPVRLLMRSTRTPNQRT